MLNRLNSYVISMLKRIAFSIYQVIMPNTACENGNMAAIYKQIMAQLPNTQLVLVQRKYFNEKEGIQCVKDLCVPEYNTVFMEVKSK